MTDELMEQRMAELNARNTEKAPAFDSEKRRSEAAAVFISVKGILAAHLRTF